MLINNECHHSHYSCVTYSWSWCDGCLLFPSELKGVPPTLHTIHYGEYFLEGETQKELPTLKETGV